MNGRFETNVEIMVSSFQLISTYFLVPFTIINQSIKIMFELSTVRLSFNKSCNFFSFFAFSNVIGWQVSRTGKAGRCLFIGHIFLPYKTEADTSILAFSLSVGITLDYLNFRRFDGTCLILYVYFIDMRDTSFKLPYMLSCLV